MNEPQLILLESQGNFVLAVAISSDEDDSDIAPFFATTVTPANFERYMDGYCDLRFLFEYAKNRSLYLFDLMKMNDGRVLMSALGGDAPEHYLPLPRLFSSHHTEEYKIEGKASDEQRLLIDGEWEMSEFGRFYSKYSDVYAFVAAANNWKDDARSLDSRRKIRDVFLDKPFKGGSSYVHFYKDLAQIIPRDEKLGLDSISYASPGEVNIVGDANLLLDVEVLITHFLDNRAKITRIYKEFYSYLSRNKYLQVGVGGFSERDASTDIILEKARHLHLSMSDLDFQILVELAEANALVVAKIVLSFFRRIEESATFFAEGRMNYELD